MSGQQPPGYPPQQPTYGGQPGWGQQNPYQQPSGQQPAAQQPYGRPGQNPYQPPSGQQPYGQPGQNPYPQAAGQPGYGPPSYAASYGQQPMYGPPGAPPPQPGAPGGPPPRKSPALIIGIVAAAVVLLVAVGGIFIALSGGGTEPVSTITPAPPSEQPQPSTAPSTGGKSSEPANPSGPAGSAIDLGKGIKLVPAAGWTVEDQTTGAVSLTNGQGVFYGRQLQQQKTTNPEQLCDAFNRAALKSAANAQFGEPETADVGSSKLTAAVCGATFTATSGDKTTQVLVSNMVSIRKSDGLAVIGTLLYVKDSDQQTKTDASEMMSSMITSQAR